ncbi:aminotransferase class V-fold PLP-dependent enzyme [Elioraea sp.]|uniref:aminotransferase class V-fold PLP-dependent enzyme n=1 Tax=Elioraea sp. TaxID=2185103 RepID=UPI003F701053
MDTATLKPSPASESFAAIRARFPAAREWTYLNVGSRGIVSDGTRQAAAELIDGHWLVDVAKETINPLLATCRSEFARMIGGRPAEVAATKNVSEGLNAVATALDWQPGDNVVVSADLEHANNIYLWYGLRRLGVEVRAVPPRGTEIDAEGLAAAIDARTRIVTAASVTFTPGFRTDLATIGRAARRQGALFLVDGVQSCGVLELDVEREAIDALATSTSKGLLGLMGLGFLWVGDAWLERLSPAFVARTSIATSGHYSEIESVDFRFAPTAERFEVGNPNWVGIAAAAQAMKEINAVGVSRVEPHALGLAEALRSGLEGLGLPVQRPSDARALSHLVTIGERGAGDAYATRNPTLNRLASALTEARVRFSIRRGLLRFGFHMYSNEDDVAKVVAVAQESLAGQR